MHIINIEPPSLRPVPPPHPPTLPTPSHRHTHTHTLKEKHWNLQIISLANKKHCHKKTCKSTNKSNVFTDILFLKELSEHAKIMTFANTHL